MNQFTREQIETIIEKATKEITQQTHEDFMEATEKLSDESKNNPLAWCETAIAIAQRNSIAVMREVLIELLSKS